MKNKIILLLVLLVLLAGCSSNKGKVVIETKNKEPGFSFLDTGEQICTEDNKPVIRFFATTWCPHCKWVRETYKSVVNEYVEAGKIKAYLWETDIGDNSLTEATEIIIPEEEKEVFKKFNPRGSVPTFVFACKYLRIGNAYEAQNDLKSEKKEFKVVIDKIINENKN